MVMKLSEELKWRGFVNQTTLTDLSELDKKKWTFYHGFDASAPSQTVGNLAGMMFDRVLMRHGFKTVILAGGATSLIGDPGGKDSERILQDEETIAHNVEGARRQLKQVFRGYDFTLVNNLDWTRNMSVVHFLRDIGKYFSMTPLVQRDYIARRMGEGGSGISYTEFSYTLLQGMDFLHLYDKYGVALQVGSSDQWSNCLSGIELIRRARNAEAHVLTHPLVINKATGKKFGKSEDGAVWLDPGMTTPTQFYQFWVNVDDKGVEDYLKVYTELDKSAIDSLMDEHRRGPQKRRAQIRLAQEVTGLVHGEEELKTALIVTDILTGATQLAQAPKQAIGALRREVPSVKARPGSELAEVLVSSGLAASKSEARRLQSGGAISINGQRAAKDKLEAGDFVDGRLLIKKGKAFKDSALLEL